MPGRVVRSVSAGTEPNVPLIEPGKEAFPSITRYPSLDYPAEDQLGSQTALTITLAGGARCVESSGGRDTASALTGPAGDKAGTTVVEDVGPGPARDNQETILKADQKEDVHQQPGPPG
jgi:hypothetical protein